MMRRKRPAPLYRSARARSVLALLPFLALGCGVPEVVKVARQGDLPRLQRELEVARREGELNRGTVEELAQAVAEKEILSAAGDSAPGFIAGFARCANAVTQVLAERAQGNDEVAAAATELLFDIGELDQDELIARHGSSQNAAFRALAARAAFTPKHDLLRRELMLDPDPDVRESAFRAALMARDPEDAGILFEGSRLDPEPRVRMMALKAMGELGSRRAVSLLNDRFQTADPTTRMVIVEAWAAPASLRAGSEAWLTATAESKAGLQVVTAAAALGRRRGEAGQLGLHTLARTLTSGSPDERLLSAVLIPLSEPWAVKLARARALRDQAPSVRVALLRRLLGVKTEQSFARSQLQALTRHPKVGLDAQVALANHGDASVAPLLSKRLAAKVPAERQRSATALLNLSLYKEAARALADPERRVRSEVACSILSRSH